MRRKTLHVWSESDTALLRRDYPNRRTAEIAEQIGVTLRACYQHARNMGLRKSHAFLSSEAAGRWQGGHHAGVAHQFKPGAVPRNKGIKRPGWSAGRMKQTQFKPGQKPHTWVPVLSERDYGGYLQIKISDTGNTQRDWSCLHTLVWIEHHGPVPRGHVVVFRDGRRDNFDIANLELISRADLMRRNTIHNRVPPELRPIVMSLGQLKRRIRERVEQLEDQQGEAQ
ncbi:HNH endonuclease signature motif containing protein [Nevskia sp.]|uniref:HNH endonuclease signature motif containing protein n=1 Tax=Nevskia sp. TaxID=1929292 RepID=UPI0025FE4831|nr:HNH endonuclease signature motif containing protein [Nevskia sp.]